MFLPSQHAAYREKIAAPGYCRAHGPRPAFEGAVHSRLSAFATRSFAPALQILQLRSARSPKHLAIHTAATQREAQPEKPHAAFGFADDVSLITGVSRPLIVSRYDFATPSISIDFV